MTDKSSLFNFYLAPVDDIPPWGGDQPTLSWYSLTLGWFWIAVDGQELFRYSQPMMDHWANTSPNAALALPYDDYQVARYWRDLMELLPTALDPIPPDLAAKVADADAWRAWRDRVLSWREQSESEERWDLCSAALEWWSHRSWDAGHLRQPPKMWIWTEEDQTHFRWNTQEAQIDGRPLWEATCGEIVMPKTAFLAEARSFDARFIAAMSERVHQAKTRWSRPEIMIDIRGLESEQRERATLFENAAGSLPSDFAWDEARAAIAAINAHFAHEGM